MTKFTLALLSVLAISSQSSASADKVYGSWLWTIKPGNGLVLNLVFRFEQGLVTTLELTNTCSFKKEKTSVSVTVPVEITDTTIEVLESAEASVSHGGLDCDVNLETGTSEYKVLNGGKVLQLTAPGETKSLNLKRVK